MEALFSLHTIVAFSFGINGLQLCICKCNQCFNFYQHFYVPNTEKLCACVSVFNGKAKYAYMNISVEMQHLDAMW